MEGLSQHDLAGINGSIAQLNELIGRKMAIWEGTSDEERRAELTAELQQHEDEKRALEKLITPR